MIGAIFLSNFCVALSVYGIVKCMEPFLAHSEYAHELVSNGMLEPFFSLHLPMFIKPEWALLSALIVGLVFSFFPLTSVAKKLEALKQVIELFLVRCFVPLLPLYIFGFLLQMRYEGLLMLLIKEYGTTFFLIVGVQLSYLLLLYYGISGFSFKKARKAIINAMPSYITAFGTMSSTLTVPVSIECAVNNGVSRPLAGIAMPIMANLHLLGDSVGTPILAMVTMYLFAGYMPSFEQYFSFVIYFCTAMFAVSGIPGGGILVMIPVLISAFNFTPAMVGIVTTLYFLMDSFGTAANVMGDGALVIGVHRMVKRFIGII